MTIERYSPEKLEECALRILDVAAELRGMAKLLRQNEIDSIPLNDKKAILILDTLEAWTIKSKGKVEISLRKIGKKAGK